MNTLLHISFKVLIFWYIYRVPRVYQELHIIQRVVKSICALNEATNTILTPLGASKSQESLILNCLIVQCTLLKIAQKHFLKGEIKERKTDSSAKHLFY